MASRSKAQSLRAVVQRWYESHRDDVDAEIARQNIKIGTASASRHSRPDGEIHVSQKGSCAGQLSDLTHQCNRVAVAADMNVGQPYVNGTFLYAEVASLREMLTRQQAERLASTHLKGN